MWRQRCLDRAKDEKALVVSRQAVTKHAPFGFDYAGDDLLARAGDLVRVVDEGNCFAFEPVNGLNGDDGQEQYKQRDGDDDETFGT